MLRWRSCHPIAFDISVQYFWFSLQSARISSWIHFSLLDIFLNFSWGHITTLHALHATTFQVRLRPLLYSFSSSALQGYRLASFDVSASFDNKKTSDIQRGNMLGHLAGAHLWSRMSLSSAFDSESFGWLWLYSQLFRLQVSFCLSSGAYFQCFIP